MVASGWQIASTRPPPVGAGAARFDPGQRIAAPADRRGRLGTAGTRLIGWFWSLFGYFEPRFVYELAAHVSNRHGDLADANGKLVLRDGSNNADRLGGGLFFVRIFKRFVA